MLVCIIYKLRFIHSICCILVQFLICLIVTLNQSIRLRIINKIECIINIIIRSLLLFLFFQFFHVLFTHQSLLECAKAYRTILLSHLKVNYLFKTHFYNWQCACESIILVLIGTLIPTCISAAGQCWCSSVGVLRLFYTPFYSQQGPFFHISLGVCYNKRSHILLDPLIGPLRHYRNSYCSKHISQITVATTHHTNSQKQLDIQVRTTNYIIEVVVILESQLVPAS